MNHALDISHNLDDVRNRIAQAAARAGRNPLDITLIAVTKTVDTARMREAFELGVRDFGENRIQEAAGKTRELDITVTWHMVGHLQTNKAKEAVRLFDVIHSIDSFHVAAAVSRCAGASGKSMRILLEVNVSGEPQKFGLHPDQVVEVANEIAQLPSLRVEGLMTIAPIVAEPEQAKPFFRNLRELSDELKVRLPGLPWRHLSMGMTDDFEVAIQEGATMIRVGRAIFGARPSQ